MRDLPKLKLDLNKPEKFGNVAELFTADERRTLANDLILLIGVDERSMDDWQGRAEKYLDKINSENSDENPQDREQGGSGEETPPSTEMTLSAIVQFAARATAALLGEPDLAKASEPGGEALAAWVSSQLRTKDKNWVLNTDPLVIHMAATGLAWRKRDFDDIDRVFHSYFLTSQEVIVNAGINSIERAPRITHQFERYPYEIERSISRKHWVDYEPRFDELDPQAPKRFYECDLWIDLDDDGVSEPWTVVISRDDTAEVVKIKPRWSKKTVADSDEALFFNPFFRFYPYMMFPDPRGGFLPMGFGRMLDRTQSSADELLGNITDTAKSEAANGGVVGGSQFGVPDKIELKNNRLVTIPTDGQSLEKMMQLFPAKQVSQGSVATLEKLITLGDRISGTMNMLENAPASMTATLAKGIIDTGTQVQSAVHRRLVAEMTQEFHMFVRMADAYDMLPNGVSAQDGDGVAVTADPALATEMQRSAMGGLYMQMIELGAKVPGSFNVQEAALRFNQVMRLPNPEKLVAAPVQPQASPFEKIKGFVEVQKVKTKHMEVMGGIAVSLTQALKNLVEAGGGMIDSRMALLQMSQLEATVQQLMQGAADANSSLDGMASQQGSGAPALLAPPSQDGSGTGLPSGGAGGPVDPGQGGGVS